MKGIILAGGAGSRLYPLTLVSSKQLQPVYDKPMVYYPFCTLLECGVDEICLISTPLDIPRFRELLGDGSRFGVRIVYEVQEHPKGIAEAFLVGESFIRQESVCLILGDNIFYGSDVFRKAFEEFKSGAVIFGYQVRDPRRYGVVELDSEGSPISLEEKPSQPKSNLAVPGLYFYDNEVIRITRNLKPSARGELEITDVNRRYMEQGDLKVYPLHRGIAWLDAGTSSSLHEASAYVQTIEKRQGVKIGCPEEIALRRGLLESEGLEAMIEKLPDCEYKNDLEFVLNESMPLLPSHPSTELKPGRKDS